MKHLLSISDCSRAELEQLLELTDAFVEVSRRQLPKVPALRGKNVVWLFYEDSTRTRLSFEQAAKRLSADTMNFTVGASSVKKGESLRDTVLTIEAMGVDAVVARHASAGAPWQIARWLDDRISVINAGDGWHEHPTQALLDAYTIREQRGTLDGLRIAIVGDVRHSRVARSDVLAFSALGAEVTLVAPPTLLPPSLEGWPVRVSHDLDAVVADVDVMYLLRMQRERMTEHLVPTLREYTARFGLTSRRAASAARRRAGHAPRADEPRRGDLGRGRRPAPRGDPRSGAQRSGGANGCPLPPARLRCRPDPGRRPCRAGRRGRAL